MEEEVQNKIKTVHIYNSYLLLQYNVIVYNKNTCVEKKHRI